VKHKACELPHDRKSLLKLVRDWGWSSEPTAKNHIKITNRTGQFIYMSGTPGDFRALEKLRSDLKRLGLPAHSPIKEDKPLPEPKLVVSQVVGDSTEPVAAAKLSKKKGRPVKEAILRALKALDREEGVNADELLPEVAKEVPDIKRNEINSSLSYYKAQKLVAKVSFGRYRILAKAPANVAADDDFAVLEEALTVLAKLEGVVKRLKEQRAQIEAAKAAFNAIK